MSTGLSVKVCRSCPLDVGEGMSVVSTGLSVKVCRSCPLDVGEGMSVVSTGRWTFCPEYYDA